ncbi:hypothetical protein [Undibacterium terreum]|uniref:DUF2306 domain-containing protein n=1 Tax=Undibacterium terreum TaxID=1224302 RepID=A0A916UAY6_9BURK|nr:hypothetical protein [Undibacterium terreum]GGC66791.1 hypothetical protein GCM10011396_12290 [Undibacterium terreum]
MFGLTPVGFFHTLISITAVIAGICAYVQERRIHPDDVAGEIYIWATIFACLTGFGLFVHGGFGKAHVLGIATLLVLTVAALAGKRNIFGRASLYVETVFYSATFLFHMIPGMTETLTRLPAGRPVFANPEDPGLQALMGILFLLFLIGAGYQVKSLRPALSENRVERAMQ